MDTDYLTDLRYMGLISRVKRLSDSTMADGRKLYQHVDIGIEPNWYLIFLIIQEKKQTSISEISAILKFSHPSVITIVKKMDLAGYLIIENHPTDKRMQSISLSEKAVKQLPEMQGLWSACEKAIESLFIDDIFLERLKILETALEEKNFYKRVLSIMKEDQINIRAFKKTDAKYFASLNEEWLKQYFSIEPIDELILNNPTTHIINKGGHILMASMEDKVVGTVALIPYNLKEIELGKMAVNPDFQGMGIGKKLLQKSIEMAKNLSFENLILYSNTKLIPAINLYRKQGFKEVELEPDGIYKRSNIKMTLDLRK